MYMESISGLSNPGVNTQMAAWQQASKISGKGSAKVSDKPVAKAAVSNAGDKTFSEVSDSLAPKVTAPKAAAPKTTINVTVPRVFDKAQDNAKVSRDTQADKKESTDLATGVQTSGETDGAVTLSIQADKRQLIDEQKNVDIEKLRKIMRQMAESIPNDDAKFGIHEKTNRIMIKLIDRDTQEVIKEFPPEKSLDMLAKRLAIAGVLVDQRL